MRKDKNSLLRRALDSKVKRARKRGRPKYTWLKTVMNRVESWPEQNGCKHPFKMEISS